MAMVYRPASSALAWLLAGGLGVVSLLGSGLHQFPGMGHGPEGVACDRQSHSLMPGDDSQRGQDRWTIAGAHPECCHDGSNCPICNYLAQGKVLGESFAGVSVSASVPNRVPAAPLVWPSPDLLPAKARAPPAV
jgi:hypothetical protein